jgi:thiol-disulfide isomerase/thioredoxin
VNNSEKYNTAKKDVLANIENKDRTFVLFYAKWCSFSRRFLPVFEEFSRDNPNDCLAVILDDDPNMCKKYSIKYYPTVIMSNRGKV